MPPDPGSGADRLVIYPSRRKSVLIVLGAIGFVLAGLWIGSPGMARRVAFWQVVVATYIGVPFFGCCGLYALYRLVLRRPAVEIDSTGITDTASALGVGRLRWTEIERVVLYRYSGQAMLGIIPKDLDGFLQRQGAVRRFITRLNLALGTAPVNLPQVMLPMTVAELADVLHARYGVRVEGHV